MRGYWGERVPKVEVICLCGEKFRVTEGRIAAGRGRYCSQRCRALYSNIGVKRGHYTKRVVNTGWFLPGRVEMKGEASSHWRGGAVGYRTLHLWIASVRTKPETCVGCGERGKLDWANLSHEYRRDPSDWVALCRPCHGRHDSGAARGAATARFGRRAMQGGL